jgi:hypothetical protein
MSVYTRKIEAQFLDQLRYGDYYQVNSVAIRILSVSYLERLWRVIGHFLGLCDSTVQKCHRLSLEQLKNISTYSQAPRLDISLHYKHLDPEQPQHLWIAYKIQGFDRSAQEMVEAIGWLPFLAWVETYGAQKLLAVFERTSQREKQKPLPPVQPVGKRILGGGALLALEHIGIAFTDRKVISRYLRDARFCNQAKDKPLTLDLEAQPLAWPLDEEKQVEFDALHDVFRLFFTGISKLEIDMSRLTAATSKQLLSLLEHTSVGQITLNCCDPEPQVLPLDLALALAEQPSLEQLDLGPFVWPLRKELLPATFTTSQSALRQTAQDSMALDLTWQQLQTVQSLCPSVDFIDESGASYSVPEGVLRRVSSYYNRHFQRHPSHEHLTRLSSSKATLMVELVQASLKGFSGPFKNDRQALIQAAIEFEMPYALLALQRTATHFCHVNTDKAVQSPMTAQEDLLSDITLELEDGALEIDLYHLALQAPTRSWGLSQYPRHQPLPREEDKQIQSSDLRSYFSGQRLELKASNLSSFWAIALAFEDATLLTQIQRWLQDNLYRLHQFNTQLEAWGYLAISCQDTFPLMLELLRPHLSLR